tara:strand:+ start:87 stop:266 length:180 start_codon:yes stop_codon:yes gene_type:complete
MKKIKEFFGEYGFYIASIIFFATYISSEDRQLSELMLATVFFILGATKKKIKPKEENKE